MTHFPSQNSTPSPAPTARRHDLDALRAFAMLLGIGLHAGLAYAPIPWIAMNRETSPALGAFVEITHGFRLPLFFLMSGFFSAMLLQRRGIRGFLRHRAKRIGLPLLLGMVTVIPAMWAVIIGGNIVVGVTPPPQREWSVPADDAPNIWSAAASGDLPTVQRLVQSGAPVNEPDPRVYTLPLAWASIGDNAEAVAFLLESGADPNRRMGDDNTPLHTACFFGAADSAALLLDAGADLGARNKGGETPIDSMRHGRGAVDFIANLLGVTADYEKVEAGRREIARLIESLPARSETGDQPSPVRDAIAGLVRGELFMHLWFLWHLCWLACALALATALLRTLRFRGVPPLLISTPVCLFALIPLTAITQSWQSGFGPDTSAGLIPAPRVLAHYAVFFGFGALMFTGRDAADRLGRAWWVHLPIAALAGACALRLTHEPLALAETGLNASTAARLEPILQAVFVWTASLGLMGLARVLLSAPSERVRFVSDSSYWLYIAHLPLIVAGQFALAYLDLPPFAEFALLTGVVTGLLLLSYRAFVRYTWIGRLLNGPRPRPGAGLQPREAPGLARVSTPTRAETG